MSKSYDTIIVGGGFYGLRIAQYLREELDVKKILVIEKAPTVMSRASYNNQARVHNGYHYPRSVLTALRSRVNLPYFITEYKTAVREDSYKYYAVARNFSKVTAQQYERFFERIGADIKKAPEAEQLFDSKLIEAVFKVTEYTFDTTIIKEQLLQKLKTLGVEIKTQEEAETFMQSKNSFELVTNKATYSSSYLINTTYTSINKLNLATKLPIIPLKHELTEMCLVKMPPELQGKAFTIMCGPFFSLMPFPARGDLYTLSHVRYTPHSEWTDTEGYMRDGHQYMDNTKQVSHFPQMQADIKRYMPVAEKISYTGESLWEVKTVLPKSEDDDSRPIMYLENHGGVPNYICIMGGKIDNIYDVFRELKETYAKA